MKKFIVIFCLLSAIASIATMVHVLLTFGFITDLIINGAIFVVILVIGIILTSKSKDGEEFPLELKLIAAVIFSVLSLGGSITNSFSRSLAGDVFFIYCIFFFSGLTISLIMNSFVYIMEEE